MPYFGIRSVALDFVKTGKKWPDIWLQTWMGYPKITVTEEWVRRPTHERRKRLVHELLHTRGLNHPFKGGKRIGKLFYSTFPDKDTFSMIVYKDILAGNKWNPRRFGL